MCKELCDANEEMQSCHDCGRLICWDVKGGDDIIRPAYVTASADLYCDRCGPGNYRAEEEEYEPDDWPDDGPYFECQDLGGPLFR